MTMEGSPSSTEEQRPKQLFLIVGIVIALGLLACGVLAAGFGFFSIARNAVPASMPAEMAGDWQQNGNLFAFCSNSLFPDQLSISEDGSYSGTGGSLWQGGNFQVLLGERVRLATRQGPEVYRYDLQVLSSSASLDFEQGLMCRVSYSRPLEP